MYFKRMSGAISAVLLTGATPSVPSVTGHSVTGHAADAPAQFHTAFAGPTSFRVSWKSDVQDSICVHGPSPSALSYSANGTSIEYLSGYGFHHHVLIETNSTAGGGWYWSCGSSNVANRFALPPIATNFSTMIFGDWGYLDSQRPGGPMLPVGGLQGNWSAVLVRELMEGLHANGSIGQVIIAGDIAYSDDSFGHLGTALSFGYEGVMDGWFSWIENVSTTIPFMVAPGNHESECHSPACVLNATLGQSLRNFSAYNARWAMPSPESGGVANMWHSWDVAGVHFVSLDTSTDFPDAPEGTTGDSHMPQFPAGSFAPDGAYMSWVERDLAAASASPDVNFIVGVGHRPFDDLPAAHAANLTALFKQHGVSFYFAGHGHSYLRASTDTWGDGTVHVMVGGAGCDEMPYPADQDNATSRVGVPAAEACARWCSDPVVRASFASHHAEATATSGDIDASASVAAEPCRYCGSSPAFATAQMAAGVLTSSPTSLTWRLLLAPRGEVLDEITVTKN